MLVGPSLIPLARIVVDAVSNMAGMVIVVTGLTAGGLRALAVLTDSPPERVEWMTAVGFGGGIALSALLFFLDLAIG